MPRGGRQPGAGKPKAIVDLEKVKSLAAFNCTGEELAAELGIDRQTLFNRKDISAAIKQGRFKGIISLKRAAYALCFVTEKIVVGKGKAAKTIDTGKLANPALMIFMLKNLAGYRNSPDINVLVAPGGNVTVEMLEALTPEERLSRIRQLREELLRDSQKFLEQENAQ